MGEKSFRVLLDLSEINKGESEVKHVWISVSTWELNTIFDFKRAINKKIPLLQENYELFLRDGLLLENEKISILRDEDVIKLKLENFQPSFQEHSFRSLNQIVTGIHPDKPIYCDSSNSKGLKKRKSDIFNSSGKESSSIPKQKKKKHYKSPRKSNSENENASDITLNSMPDLSYDVSELSKESKKKKSSFIKKNMDCVTNDRAQVVKGNAKSKTFRNDCVSCAFTHSPEVEKSVIYESDLNFTNSQDVNLENESSQKKQTIKYDSKSETFRSDTVSYDFTHSLEIEKSADVCESGVNFTKTNSQIVNPENEFSQTVENLEACSPKHNECKKRRRKRKRKRKESIVASESCVLTTPLESNIIFNTTLNTSDKRKHIVYKSPISSPPKIETVTLNPDFITHSELQDTSQSLSKEEIESAGLSELDMCVARFVEENKYSISENQQNTLSSIADMSLKISTPYPKKKLKGQSWGITPLSANSNTASNTFIIEDCNTSKKETTFKSYTEYASLNCLPQVGTRLAFKVLELNEKYCPEVTDYKEGIVKNIDPDTDELTIELVEEEVRLGRRGKFENLKEDEIPSNEIIKTVKLNWSAIISPKQIS